MQKILGIDLGASAVKAVAIESSFRSHTVRAYRAEPVEPYVPPAEGEQPKTYADRCKAALEAFAKDGWFAADQIICSLPGAQVAAHAVTLPFVERKQIDSTLPGEVETVIPFDLADVVFDSTTVSKGPQRTDLFVAVAQRAQVKAILEMLKAAGVDPAIVTFSAISLAGVIAEKYVEDEPLGVPGVEGPLAEAVLDIGAERTNILILENGEARFARSAAPAGNDVTQALARALGVPAAEAEEKKRTFDLRGGDAALTPVVERSLVPLVRDVRATFGAYASRTRHKVSRVRVTGGGSQLQGLVAFLSNALGITVEPLSLRASPAFTTTADAKAGALALALALRGLNGGATPKLNFRRGDLAYAQEVGEMRSLYAGFAAMAALVFLLFGVSMWAKLNSLEKREAKLDAALCDATKKIYGTCETDYRVALGKLQGTSSAGAVIPQISAVELLVKISDLFPQSGDAVLNDVDITDGSIRLRGDAKAYDNVDDLVSDLQGDKCFTDVKRGKQEKNAAGRVEFSLDATYACGGLGKEGS